MYYFLDTYATNDVIAEAEDEVVSFRPPVGMTADCYSEAFCKSVL